MRCSHCDELTMQSVIDTRYADHGRCRRRRRECSRCGMRRTTYEVFAEDAEALVDAEPGPLALLETIANKVIELRVALRKQHDDAHETIGEVRDLDPILLEKALSLLSAEELSRILIKERGRDKAEVDRG